MALAPPPVRQAGGVRLLQPRGSAMSKCEVERFAKDLKTKPALLSDVQLDAVSGGTRSVLASGRPPILPFEKD